MLCISNFKQNNNNNFEQNNNNNKIMFLNLNEVWTEVKKFGAGGFNKYTIISVLVFN